MSLNKAMLIGRLGQDPEIRYSQAGMPVASFSVATSERWKDKQTGETKEKTEWHNITAFGRLAEIVGQYIVKGTQVFVDGKITTEKYQDRNTGIDKYVTKIIANNVLMLGGKGEHQEQQQFTPPQKPNKPISTQKNADLMDDLPADDIPF